MHNGDEKVVNEVFNSMKSTKASALRDHFIKISNEVEDTKIKTKNAYLIESIKLDKKRKVKING